MRANTLALMTGAAMVVLGGCASHQQRITPASVPLADEANVASDTARIAALLAQLHDPTLPAWADSLLRGADGAGSSMSQLLLDLSSASADTTRLRSLLDALNDPRSTAWADTLLMQLRASNGIVEPLDRSAADAELRQLLDLLTEPRTSTPRPH